MSGPATVPLAILALYVSSHALRALYGALAVLCAGYTSYKIWLNERTALDAERAKNRRPYDEHRREAAAQLLQRYSVQQRDLLRFVSLHANPTANTINQSTRLTAQEVRQDIQHLEREDILPRHEDNLRGVVRFSVNQGWSSVFQDVLFPRYEPEDRPFYASRLFHAMVKYSRRFPRSATAWRFSATSTIAE